MKNINEKETLYHIIIEGKNIFFHIFYIAHASLK